jgi:hypothetical protein
MGIWIFSLAAILSLPKQFAIVYLGVVLEHSGTGKDNSVDGMILCFAHTASAGPSSTKNRILNAVVIGTTGLITVLAAYYILRKMGQVKVDVIYQRRKARYVSIRILSETRSGY